mgnify:CR=1 FL=1
MNKGDKIIVDNGEKYELAHMVQEGMLLNRVDLEGFGHTVVRSCDTYLYSKTLVDKLTREYGYEKLFNERY